MGALELASTDAVALVLLLGDELGRPVGYISVVEFVDHDLTFNPAAVVQK